LFLEKLAHEPHSGSLVSFWLDEQVKNLALAVHGSPQPQSLAPDRHDHFVEVPLRTRARTPGPQPAGELQAELPHPAPDRLIGDVEAALGQKLLDITVAQCEPKIEPYRLADDLGRVPVTRVGDRLHARSYSGSAVALAPVLP